MIVHVWTVPDVPWPEEDRGPDAVRFKVFRAHRERLRDDTSTSYSASALCYTFDVTTQLRVGVVDV
jgi:hypothetical protein